MTHRLQLLDLALQRRLLLRLLIRRQLPLQLLDLCLQAEHKVLCITKRSLPLCSEADCAQQRLRQQLEQCGAHMASGNR